MKLFIYPTRVVIFIFILQILLKPADGYGQALPLRPIKINTSSNLVDFKSNLSETNLEKVEYWSTSEGYLKQIPTFKNFPIHQLQSDEDIHWMGFSVYNKDSIPLTLHLSVAFSDYCDLYFRKSNSTTIQAVRSGDKVPLKDRAVKIGQVAFLPFSILPKDTVHCLVRITNSSRLSHQFASLSAQYVKLYPPEVYRASFEQPRSYQSFFYGAVAIMILFNFFIFITTRSISYLYYVCFLFSLAFFLASNNGYLLEIAFPNLPTLDLYLRFVSAPLLLVSYLVFSQNYLQSKLQSPNFHPIINALILGFLALIPAMFLGVWYWSRFVVIALSILSFFVILWVAIQAIRKGYSPAKFFLAGNALLLLGGIVFSIQRIYAVVPSPATQYSLQIAAMLEIVLFSLGLADRINVTQRELNLSKILKERTEKEAEIERKKIIEEKNKALLKSNQELDAFIYKTAHDIRGPLARLMGLCSIAQLDVTDHTALEYLDKLNTNANNLNFILARLTKVYEISSLQVAPEPIDFNLIIKDTIASLSFYEGFANTEFKITIPANLPFINDDRLVRFICLNLIENAVKFQILDGMEPHRVIIDIKNLDNGVILEVSDSGVGIKEEDSATIFDIFSKAADQYQTPGLGMHMTKIGLEKIGGSVTLDHLSSPTRFLAYIPRL